MKRIREWLYNKFLPAWCRDDLLTENARLRQQLADAQARLDRQRAYIDGMIAAMRQQRRISVHNEVKS